MDEKAGAVFSIARDNGPVAGCTLSRQVQGEPVPLSYFSLAAGTDISAEVYPSPKLLLAVAGGADLRLPGGAVPLRAGDAAVTPAGVPVGMRSERGAVYAEILMRGETKMNEAVKPGVAFKLADLVPYRDGGIVNMDVASNDKMKFAVMSFDVGTGLSEHAAPGEALVFALEGAGTIVYEGEEHAIQAGENFHFAKGGMHAVKAPGKFKMALLLTLE